MSTPWRLRRRDAVMVIEIRGYAADGCTYIREETVAEPGQLAEEWWTHVVFPLTGDGRHPKTRTTEVATVVEASNSSFLAATMTWEG